MGSGYDKSIPKEEVFFFIIRPSRETLGCGKVF